MKHHKEIKLCRIHLDLKVEMTHSRWVLVDGHSAFAAALGKTAVPEVTRVVGGAMTTDSRGDMWRAKRAINRKNKQEKRSKNETGYTTMVDPQNKTARK